MKTRKKKILLVGGGTGGHIVPLLNIYKELNKTPGLLVYVVGGRTKIDKKLYGQIDNFTPLLTGKLHRRLSLDNLMQALYLLVGLFRSLIIILSIKPDLIFSKASYISFPIIFWARVLKIPYMIHESDIEMGAANRFAAHDAEKIFVGFPVSFYSKALAEKIIYTGQILRPEIGQPEACKFDFGFTIGKPVIFITGGSQGSTNINAAIFDSINYLLSNYNVIHHVGSVDLQKAIEIRSQLPEKERSSYFVSELLTDDLAGTSLYLSAVAQASIVVSRASSSFAEFAAMGKAVIAVPYKYAASDHQNKNAAFFEHSNAAIIVHDDDVSRLLIPEIDDLGKNKNKMTEISKNAKGLFPNDGLRVVANHILKFLGVDKKQEQS